MAYPTAAGTDPMTMQRKIVALAAGICVGLGLVVAFIILPTWREIQRITAAIQSERESLEFKYQRGQRMRKVALEYRKVKQYRDRLNAMYIPSGDELEFITTLEHLRREYGVDAAPALEQIREDLPPNAPLPLTVTVRGSYRQILAYLFALERLHYYYDIGNIAVKGTDPGRGDVTVVLSGSAFRKPMAKAPAAGRAFETPTTTAEIVVPPADENPAATGL